MPAETVLQNVKDRVVLVVEDDFFIAEELRFEFERLGARVLGPAPTVSEALQLIASSERIDGATLDVTLGRDKVFPVADALRERGAPFVFLTGYDDWALPERYRDAPRSTKPADARELVRALFGWGQP